MRSGLRLTFFLVNLSAAILFLVLGVIASFSGDRSPFAGVGAFFFVWPAVAFGIGEVVLFRRGSRPLERSLGAVCGMMGGLAFLTLIASALAAPSNWEFWLSVGGTCIGVTIYGFWCCWWRMNRADSAKHPGFPVGPPSAVLRVEPLED